jgi:predicted dehydrogenase
MTDNPLPVAFLGCGFATRMHSKTLAKIPNAKRYYASRDLRRAQSFAAEFGGVAAFSSYQEAIQSPDIEVIIIATPPVQHLELTLAALSAGKHVIVEKPPFLKATDFDRIREKQQQAGRQIMVAENYFYKPLAYRLRHLLKSNIIGDLLFVHFNALKKQQIRGWRGDLKVAGGGELFEGGIHWINFIANLGLEIESIRGYLPAPRQPFEKSILVALQYRNGPVGSFYYSWETPSLFKGLRLSKFYGREGSITFESNGLFIIVRGRKKRILFPGLADIAGYRAMFRDFFKSIQSNQQPEFTLDKAERDVKLIEAIYDSV